jgi:hypothetical protein
LFNGELPHQVRDLPIENRLFCPDVQKDDRGRHQKQGRQNHTACLVHRKLARVRWRWKLERQEIEEYQRRHPRQDEEHGRQSANVLQRHDGERDEKATDAKEHVQQVE